MTLQACPLCYTSLEKYYQVTFIHGQGWNMEYNNSRALFDHKHTRCTMQPLHKHVPIERSIAMTN